MTKQEIDILNNIAEQYGYKIFGDEYSLCCSNTNTSFYAGDIFYDENRETYEPVRFNVSFHGFGCLSEENENIVYNELVNAKKCVDALNEKLTEIYKNRGCII